MLDWLHKEYWSRQLGGQLSQDWDSSGEQDEEDYTQQHEEILLSRQREIEGHSEYEYRRHINSTAYKQCFISLNTKHYFTVSSVYIKNIAVYI